jgi:hypothetical protein
MQLSKRLFSIILLLAFLTSAVFAQEPTKRSKSQNVTPSAASNPVTGSGSTGQITKWTGIEGTNTYTVGDSNISEDKFGKIGIGTRTPTSLLTVRGMIETTLGGYKFPDGTVQTTAAIAFVTHDASLSGLGTPASPLGIALGGVQTVHLANNAVTAPKIANGTVVRSLNNLFDNVAIVGGTNITITPSGNTLTIASPNSLTSVAHGSTLTGNGTTGSPLDVANGGIGNAQLADNAVGSSKVASGAIGTAQLADNAVSSAKVASGAIGNTQLADNAVTFSKIASGQVVTSVNNLKDNVTLAAGANITITPSGNTLTIAEAASSSMGYFVWKTEYVDLDPPGGDLISKEVPAGSYLIFFKASFFNGDGDLQIVGCSLSTGDSSQIRLAGNDGDEAAIQGILVLKDAATFSNTTTIKVHCRGFNVTTVGRYVLTALKINSIE